MTLTTTQQSLQDAIDEAGGAIPLMRSSTTGAYPFPIPPEFTSWRDEQAAWKATAVLFDQSHHMTDISFRGPDVRRLLSEIAVNDFSTFGRDRAKQMVVCSEEGHHISDGIVFGLEDDLVSIVGNPLLPHWVAYQAETGRYDVEVLRDERTLANRGPRRLFRFQVQGPEALKIVAEASDGTLLAIPFFRIGSFRIAGRAVRALNHTMTGKPGQEFTGLEIFGSVEDSEPVRDALLAAGANHGLRQGGAIAYSTTATESGWLGTPFSAIYLDDSMTEYRRSIARNSFEGSASVGGSFSPSDPMDYLLTPYDLGLGRVVKLDHDFIGRDALAQLTEDDHRRKVWLRWNDDDADAAWRDNLFGSAPVPKLLKVPFTGYSTFEYDSVLRGETHVGVSNRCNYTVNVGGYHSLAVLDRAAAQDGTEVELVWGEPDDAPEKPAVGPHRQVRIRATVRTDSPVRR